MQRLSHSATQVYGPRDVTGRDGTSSMKMAETPEAFAEVEHPLVRTHPETGRKSLFLSSHTANIVGMTNEESAPILSFLRQHAVRPEFTCRFRWEPGSFAIWDDRCTQHFAINDYNGQRRVMHRITVRGDVPV